MELNSLLAKVRALVALAEHPGTPEAEASSARSMADSLMLKYAIDEATLDASRPAELRGKPEVIEVELTGHDDLAGWIATLCQRVAQHARCRVRLYAAWRDGSWISKVYGFESDLRYFEVLYTTLRLHMVGVLAPKLNPAESLEDNAYRLHEAGYNWLDIAELYGWRKQYAGRYPDVKIPYQNADGEVQPSSMVGSRVKRAYYRAIKERNEQPTLIAAGGTGTYRRSAAQGYVTRISQRLREVAERRDAGGSGAELVLANREQTLEDFWKEANPDLYAEVPVSEAPSRPGRMKRYVPPPFNDKAYEAGVRHANAASLSPGVSRESAKRGAIG
jgi:hypothetical protein